jgi:hypothetical protein
VEGAVGEQLAAAVLSYGRSSVRLRPLDGGETFTLRTALRGDVVPGELAHVRLARRWRYAGHAYASGEILSLRLDAAALGLDPLGLVSHGLWSPRQASGPVGLAARRGLPRHPLPDAEMEQVIPGADPEDADGETDPAIQAQELAHAGNLWGGLGLLLKAVARDLRYLDGHAHLGSLGLRASRSEFSLRCARRHYAAGVAIGDLTVGDGFRGYLRWARLDNRPYLRCLHGLAITAGRLGEAEAARQALARLLRLDPEDSLGAEELLYDLQAGRTEGWCEPD